MNYTNDTISAAELLTLPEQAQQRSKAAGEATLMTGRWGVLNSQGAIVKPSAEVLSGGYFILEGLVKHIGTPADFAGAAPFASTKSVEMPSAVAANQVAIVHGSFIAKVHSAGIDPQATYNIGDRLKIDVNGRLVVDNTDGKVAEVEEVITGDDGIEFLVFRTLVA